MKLAILIVSRNRPDLVERQAAWIRRNVHVPHDVVVVEAGTDADKVSPHATVHYEDEDFRGKCFAHNIALEQARAKGEHDYYWVLMNDVVFEEGVDAAQLLIDTLEANPRMAILSPTNVDGGYPGAERRPGGGWRAVTTCDYLGFMIRGEAVREVGFLNPSFKYCWGAIHELSYHLYRSGWSVAYSDDVAYRHLGGTTYGAPGTNTISREDYQRRAARFAYAYFTRIYGTSWVDDFWSAAAGHGIEVNTFARHAEQWARAFSAEELDQLRLLAPSDATVPTPAPDPATPGAPALPRLYLGSGKDKRAGWLNVDVNPAHAPDLVASADALPTVADASVGAIEACHLFEHFTLTQARAALREWRRVLAPGGELALELPNVEACARLIGTELDGFDLGLASLFGYPPEVDAEGEPQLHKWGWTPATLRAELEDAGFVAVEEVSLTQTWRKAASFDRDMRLVARAPSGASAAHGPAHEDLADGELPPELLGVVSRLTASIALEPTERAAAAENARKSSPSPPVTPTPPRSTAPAAGPTPEPAPARATPRKAVFAWPDYTDASGLERFFHTFARVLTDRDDVVLSFRIDPELDPPVASVLALLESTYERVLGKEAALEITLLDGPLDDADWRELSPQVHVRIRSTDERSPRDAARNLTAPVVEDPAALVALLAGRPAPASSAPAGRGLRIEPGATPDDELIRRIEALHPWFYPVQLGDVRVVPGVGSPCTPEWLENRTACRSKLLRDAVLEQVDFAGRSVLDLACNCGYWSSHYARAGARRVVGVEGRHRHVEQARLYWLHGRFLPEGAYEFLEGNVSDEQAWPRIYVSGPYDVTLCAGILYHVPDYAEVLRRAARATRELMIVDTRVTDGPEVRVKEPGDQSFNAIHATLEKVVPNRERLLATLRELGFEPEVLPVPFAAQQGVSDVDDYAAGQRVTIVARKVKAPVTRPVAEVARLEESLR